MDVGDAGVLHFTVVRPFQRELSAGGGNAEVDLAVGADGDGVAFIGRSATQVSGVGQGSAIAIELGEEGVLAAEEHLGVSAVGVGEVGGSSGADEIDEARGVESRSEEHTSELQ